MKYVNIKLLGKNNLYFVKYTDSKKVEFNKLSELDKNLFNSIKNNDPTSFGYMIFHGLFHAIGLIKIDVVNPLNVSLAFTNDVDETSKEKYIEDILFSLSRLCPFYKYIIINGKSYENKYFDINGILIDEITSFKEKLIETKRTFRESFKNNYYVESYYNRQKSSNQLVKKDLFIETDSYCIEDIKSNRNVSNISFDYDGKVEFETLGNSKSGNYSLNIIYNVDGSILKIECIRNNNGMAEIINVLEDSKTFECSLNNTKIVHNKIDGSNTYQTIKFILEDSINFNLKLDKDNYVSHCYLDINIHRSNNKIKGMYKVRIKDGKLVLYYNHRKGDKEIILEHDIDKKITLDELLVLIQNSLTYISTGEKLDINILNLEEFDTLRKTISNFIKSLNNRIPLNVFNNMLTKYNKSILKQKKLKTYHE